MKVHWHCPYLIFTALYEDEDCDCEFVTHENKENWDDECCEAVCPRCGRLLTQKDDSPEIVK